MNKMFYVDTRKVREFMEEVSPNCSFYCDYENGTMGFEFTDDGDAEAAQRWIYANENQRVFHDNKYIGDIYYHDEEYGYCFVCDRDDKDYYYFDTPEEAEDALIDYWMNKYN